MLRLLALVSGLFLAVAGASVAAPKGSDGWTARPGDAERRAADVKFWKGPIFARAVARCAVADDGALTDCRVIRETPTGAGIGDALMLLAPSYRRRPPQGDDARQVDIVHAWTAEDTRPDWKKQPTAADFLTVYPTRAMREGLSGETIINCVVTTQGVLIDCVALSETPAGQSFGAAAITLTSQFLMKPATLNGRPTPSVVSLPINFKHQGGPGVGGIGKKVMPATVTWAEAPTVADVAAAYPKKARAEKKAGHVTLACDLAASGRLANCATATSDPKNYGFDVAAKQLARQFLFPLNSEDEKKAVRNVSVHIPFTFDPSAIDSATPPVGKPAWAVIPTDAQFSEVFAPLKFTGTARTTLSCIVQPGGYLNDCRVASESPAGSGIGAAALKLSSAFRLSTWTASGLPVVGGSVSVPVRYDVPEPPKLPRSPLARSQGSAWQCRTMECQPPERPDERLAAIRISGLRRIYAEGRGLAALDMTVPANSITGFIGVNGAGKTTTLRCIMGLIRPDGGTIELLGQAADPAIRRRIGFLPEERGLAAHEKARDAIAFHARLKGLGRREAFAAADELLVRIGLGAQRSARIASLSKGNAQRVQLLCAMAHSPALLILDEPLSGLDPVGQAEVQTLLTEYRAGGGTVLFSTHSMSAAEAICDRVVVLAGGRTAFEGSVSEIAQHAPHGAVAVVAASDRLRAAVASVGGAADPWATGPDARLGGAERWRLLIPRDVTHAQLLDAVERHGVSMLSFEPIKPNLEGAFWTFAERRAAPDRDAA